MSYGLDASLFEKINSVFTKHPQVERATLYGSRAKGNFKPGSDIDLTLTGTALTNGELLAIEGELDDLLLPYKIDLPLLHHIDDPELLAHIQRVGLIFYRRA